jgi:prepilin-type N-terminal cleavage/methylation domain-containing protein
MKLRPLHGAPRPGEEGRCVPAPGHPDCRGFTLLEICFVLLIMAVLAGVTMPAIKSAFTEQAVRKDGHELALMVKTAMIQSAEQHRAYVIELTGSSASLHPMGELAPVDDTDSETSDKSLFADSGSTADFDPPNKLLAPDISKAGGWLDMPATTWVFQPGRLCPATHVRLQRDDSWLEMSFNALTGNVEEEKTYFP